MSASVTAPLPMNPFLEGLISGQKLHLAIKQQHMEQEAMELNKQRQDRQAKIEDLQTRMGLLQSGAQPTQASGAGPEVAGSIDVPGASGGPVGASSGDLNQGQAGAYGGMPAGVTAGGGAEAAPRPVNPGRTVKYGGQSYYVPTPSEQFQQQLPIMQAQAALKAQQAGAVAGAEAAAKAPYDQVDLPGVGKVGSKAVPFYTAQASQKEQDARQDKSINATADLETTREAGQDRRSAATNATSRRNTDVREAGENSRAELKGGADGGLTPNGVGVQGRALAKLQSDEQDIHQKRLSIGSALNAQEGETYINPMTGKEEEMSAARRTWLQGLMKSYDGKLSANQQAQQRANDLMSRGRTAADAKQQADAPPPIPGTQQAAPAGRVWVKNKQGQIGHIPKKQLDAALKSGEYTKAE